MSFAMSSGVPKWCVRLSPGVHDLSLAGQNHPIGGVCGLALEANR